MEILKKRIPSRPSSLALGEESVLECTSHRTPCLSSFQGEQSFSFCNCACKLTKCWSVVLRLLWTFDIMPGLDASGNPVIPSKDDFIGSVTTRPRPFVYELRFRRSDEDKVLILNESKKAQEMALAWM